MHDKSSVERLLWHPQLTVRLPQKVHFGRKHSECCDDVWVLPELPPSLLIEDDNIVVLVTGYDCFAAVTNPSPDGEVTKSMPAWMQAREGARAYHGAERLKFPRNAAEVLNQTIHVQQRFEQLQPVHFGVKVPEQGWQFGAKYLGEFCQLRTFQSRVNDMEVRKFAPPWLTADEANAVRFRGAPTSSPAIKRRH
ncbi:hypothetical protein [Sphingomonas sp. LaA6.9]|uniref:hypothetical protein n=1 Tax=Sphingomonas sp. LaA6.9 TaxID=2919914 RepID=UPI001F4F432B|nr:hypothetical protein [Sphingomonas sp. LaA6.9]MCJ8157431.1 hypothetical protein [Sphingomonas sp. LaA6.9]